MGCLLSQCWGMEIKVVLGEVGSFEGGKAKKKLCGLFFGRGGSFKK